MENTATALRYEPVFSVERDIEEIRHRPAGPGGKKPIFANTAAVNMNKAALPYLRGYILTKGYRPVVIFDRLPYEGFELFIRITNCFTPDAIDGTEGYHQAKLAKAYGELIRQKKVARPFRLAFFNADTILYHLLVPMDLVIYLCMRLRDYDIVDRTFWDLITQYG